MSATDRSSFYRPELDVVRFIAFFSVFLHHTLPSRIPAVRVFQESCGFGMCLFFFLSSYLITELLRREKLQTGSVQIPRFYTRRVLRIWPLYFGFLLFGYFYGKAVPSAALSRELILSFVFLAANWYVARNGFPNTPTGLLWSISLEEQFYLVWPFLIKQLRQKTAVAVCLALICLSAIVECLLLFGGATAAVQIWVNTFVQFQFFAMGALLAIFLAGRLPMLKPGVRTGMIAGVPLFWVGAEALFNINSYVIRPSCAGLVAGYLLVGLGCALLVAGGLGINRRWIPQPLIYLGKISYGLYVYHGLTVGLVKNWFAEHHVENPVLRGLVALGVTIVFAALSYRFFESPFLQLKERFTIVRSRGV